MQHDSGLLTWLEAELERGLADPRDPGSALRGLPKTDLHAHSLLSMGLESFETLAGKPLPRPPERFDEFTGFLDYVRRVLVPLIRSLDAVRFLTRAAFERMAGEGVVYAETTVDVFVPLALRISMADYSRVLLDECERVADRMTVCLELGLNREAPPDELEPAVASALEQGFAGSIDLYGDERAAPGRLFRRIYAMARDHGLKLKAHAGELCGPEEVREAVETLDLDAVQHGVRAAEDPRVLEFLAGRGTLLHVCPTSNVRLRVARDLASHPIRDLLAAGVRVTVASDDFAVFGAGVTDEIEALHRQAGLPAAVLAEVVANGLAEGPPQVLERVKARAAAGPAAGLPGR